MVIAMNLGMIQDIIHSKGLELCTYPPAVAGKNMKKERVNPVLLMDTLTSEYGFPAAGSWHCPKNNNNNVHN